MLPSDVDLNLLRSLERLLSTRSVTRAARELGVGQPAMSKRLERLRLLVNDELLIRQGRGMQLTPHARELVPLVGEVLAHADRVLGPREPTSSRRTEVRVAMGDETIALLGARWLEVLLSDAPHLDVRIRKLDREAPELLDSGRLDFAVVPDLSNVEGFDMPDLSRFARSALYTDRFVVVSRDRLKWTLAAYGAASHVLATPLGETDAGPLDLALSRLGQRRRIHLTVPSFADALIIVARSALIATVPEGVARTLAPSMPRASLPLPFAPETFLMLWHPRRTTDERHRLARRTLADVVPAAFAPVAK